MHLSISKLVNNLLGLLNSREREVLDARYGLKDGRPRTLAEIGGSYKVTRERIRQVEAGALADLRKFSGQTQLKDFVALVKNHLRNLGGLRREVLFLADLRSMVSDPNTQNLGNKVRFLLEVAGEPKLMPEDNDYYSYWYLNEDDRKKAASFIAKLVKLMEGKKSEVVSHGNVDSLMAEAAGSHNLKDLMALNYISASKNFHVNEYGDFGLSHWPETNPKTMRDWAHAALRKHQKPAHFRNISEMINKIRKDAKRLAHPQTVHNELIKDERFVLVGRGIYGLQEFGLMPGTAKEVMGRILKKQGPLTPTELLGQVLKERMFKKNTILINLQNKKHFKRLEDGKYILV